MMHLLDKVAVLQRRVAGAVDRLNRPTYTFVSSGTVRVHRQQGSMREIPTEAGRVEVAEWSFFIEPSRTVNRFDRLVYEGETFDLIAVEPVQPPYQPVSHYEASARVI